MTIIVNSIGIFHVVPLCMWACNSLSLIIFLTMSFHIHPLSIPHFIRTQKANLLLVAPSCALSIVRLTCQIIEIDCCFMVPPLLQPIPSSI